MDQLSGEIDVLKKYLKSKRVPEEAISELDSLWRDVEKRWKETAQAIEEIFEQ